MANKRMHAHSKGRAPHSTVNKNEARIEVNTARESHFSREAKRPDIYIKSPDLLVFATL